MLMNNGVGVRTGRGSTGFVGAGVHHFEVAPSVE